MLELMKDLYTYVQQTPIEDGNLAKYGLRKTELTEIAEILNFAFS